MGTCSAASQVYMSPHETDGTQDEICVIMAEYDYLLQLDIVLHRICWTLMQSHKLNQSRPQGDAPLRPPSR